MQFRWRQREIYGLTIGELDMLSSFLRRIFGITVVSKSDRIHGNMSQGRFDLGTKMWYAK